MQELLANLALLDLLHLCEAGCFFPEERATGFHFFPGPFFVGAWFHGCFTRTEVSTRGMCALLSWVLGDGSGTQGLRDWRGRASSV